MRNRYWYAAHSPRYECHQNARVPLDPSTILADANEKESPPVGISMPLVPTIPAAAFISAKEFVVGVLSPAE